jgi:hypothetical protein
MVSPKADRQERAVTRLLWERRFERMALAVLVVLYLAGFHTQQKTDDSITSSRVDVTRTICRTINQQAMATNRNGSYIQGLIVKGAEGSRPFEPLYRTYGFPPYQARVRMAKQQAAQLAKLKTPVLDCDRFVHQVKEANR